MPFRLQSTAILEGRPIPPIYTCEGKDISPPLQWSDAPEGTLSFALVCSDPDAPAGTWYHWAVFDIPAGAASLPQAYAPEAKVGATLQGLNDFKKLGYGGPCPPKGHGPHRYRFVLTALGTANLSLSPGAGARDVEKAAAEHSLGQAVLVGTYSRSR
ncbi:MAG: YbhB/YbcL family Raf kinase inhibitor-like protein [Rhodospirillales bacterium]|nr:YbhB/YbcL family Raf kinase inhibitor-like protein [Rhodospirillales bacterium]